jgi:hypothetical protein
MARGQAEIPADDLLVIVAQVVSPQNLAIPADGQLFQHACQLHTRSLEINLLVMLIYMCGIEANYPIWRADEPLFPAKIFNGNIDCDLADECRDL